MGQLLQYVFYGLVAGFSQFIPVSSSAHQKLFYLLLKFDSQQALLRLFVHGGALGAFLLFYRQKVSHIYEQFRLTGDPSGRRRRLLDMDAVLDGKLVRTACIPALIGALLSGLATRLPNELLLMAVLLILSGIVIYIPDYFPGGSRRARGAMPVEAFFLGFFAGISVVAGISAMALMLGFGLLKRFDRSYLLDLCILILGVSLVGFLATDLLGILVSGFSGFEVKNLIGCLLAAAASFGGTVGGILTMRNLAVKTGFSAFAFYNWGLGLFIFILYLML